MPTGRTDQRCFMNLTDIGSRLASERQARALDRSVVAKQLAMSVKQVQEIEEGGASAFYSEDHKLWAARKYARFLEVETPGI